MCLNFKNTLINNKLKKEQLRSKKFASIWAFIKITLWKLKSWNCALPSGVLKNVLTNKNDSSISKKKTLGELLKKMQLGIYGLSTKSK